MRCCRPGPGSNNQDLSLWSRILAQDQKLIDKGPFAVAILAAIAVAFAVLGVTLTSYMKGPDIREDAELRASIEDRIRPFGRVKLPGEELAAGELQVDEMPQVEPVATLLSGPQVYNEACIVCHGTGIGGAPTLEDGATWEPRIAQGMDTLYLHTLEGYTGAAGYMPPKGARLDLSDQEISDAVDYMLSQVTN